MVYSMSLFRNMLEILGREHVHIKEPMQHKEKSKVLQTTSNVQSNMHNLRQASDVDKENTEEQQISKKSFRSKTPIVVKNYTRAPEIQCSYLQVNASMVSSILEAQKRMSRGSYMDIYKEGSNVDISHHANKHDNDTNMQSHQYFALFFIFNHINRA